MGKNKKRAQKRKEGLKEFGQGIVQAQVKSAGKGLLGGLKGAAEGFSAGTGLPDKAAKAITGAIKGGIKGSIKDSALGTVKIWKGLAKAIFNDLRWYENYPELLKGMAGANFSIDDSIEMTFDGTGANPQSKGLIAIHGVALSNGSSEKLRNMAIQKIFESTRRANSGSVNYSTADINAYYIIIRNIVALASELRRGYGLTNCYTTANLAVPNLYLTATRCDSADFIANSANIRNYLKQLNKRLEIYVPLKLPIIERTEWMFRNLFADSDDVKAQPHAFVVTDILNYNVSNQAWEIVSLPATNPLTSAQYISLIEGQMTALTRVCPAGIIAGDMLKAFGTDHLYHFGDTEEDYHTPFGYSEEVLTQIQNLIIPYSHTLSSTADAYGLEFMDLVCSAIPTSASAAMGKVCVRDMNEPSINFYKNEISNVDIIGASRLMVSAQATVTAASTNFKLHYGTEIATGSFLYYIQAGVVSHATFQTYESVNVTNVNSVFQTLREWSAIDWMPRYNATVDYYNSTGSQLRTSIVDVWDYNNSGFLSILSMQAMHEIALASLYYVPLLSKVQNNLVEVKS